MREFTFFLIVILSVFISLFYQIYQPVGPQLIVNSEFSRGFTDWRLSGDGVSLPEEGLVRISNQGEQSVTVSQMIELPADINDLVLMGHARSDSIVIGDKPWNSGRVVLVSYAMGSIKPLYSRPHELLRLSGTNRWQKYRELFHVYPGIDRMKLQLQLSRAAGDFYVKDLQLYAVVYKDSWVVIQFVMILSAVGFLAWVFFPYAQNFNGRSGLFALFSILAIVAFTAMPNALKNFLYSLLQEWLSFVSSMLLSQSGTVEGREVTVVSQVLTGKVTYFFALMHYLFFFVATVFLLFSFSDRSVRQKVYDLFTLAVLTECIQVFVRDRGASLADVGVDLFGVMTGVIIYSIYMNFKSTDVKSLP